MNKAILLSLILSTLAFSAPLLLAALGELVGERAGVLNIGLESMMLAGAWAGAAASFAARSAGLGVVAAMAAGLAMAALFALLSITLRADAIIVGTGMNLFALGLTGVMHRSLSTRFGNYDAVTLPEWCFMLVALALIPLLWWGFRATRLGLQVRAVGEYPVAADTAGVNVVRTRWLCALFNGALCGLAGGFLSMSNTNSFAENMTAGRGFIALAIVIFGRWNPFGALGAALLFGAADATQNYLQTNIYFQARIGTYYPLLLALPYLLTLLTLAGFTGTSRAPAALAQPYER